MAKLWTCLLTPRERICISFVKLWLICPKDSKSNKLSTSTICFLKMLETLLSSLQAFCKVSMSEETISLSSMETVSLSSSLLMEVLSLLSQVQASTLDWHQKPLFSFLLQIKFHQFIFCVLIFSITMNPWVTPASLVLHPVTPVSRKERNA